MQPGREPDHSPYRIRQKEWPGLRESGDQLSRMVDSREYSVRIEQRGLLRCRRPARDTGIPLLSVIRPGIHPCAMPRDNLTATDGTTLRQAMMFCRSVHHRIPSGAIAAGQSRRFVFNPAFKVIPAQQTVPGIRVHLLPAWLQGLFSCSLFMDASGSVKNRILSPGTCYCVISNQRVAEVGNEAPDAGLSGRFRADYRETAISGMWHPVSITRDWQNSKAFHQCHCQGVPLVTVTMLALTSLFEQLAYSRGIFPINHESHTHDQGWSCLRGTADRRDTGT
jgi:hypothetical protein